MSLNPGTVARLTDYLQNVRLQVPGETHIFLTQDGRPLVNHRVKAIVALAGKRAGLGKHLGPHALRHTAARLKLRNGADLWHVKQMLGHSSLKTTEIYLEGADDRERVHQTSSPVANLLEGKRKAKANRSEQAVNIYLQGSPLRNAWEEGYVSLTPEQRSEYDASEERRRKEVEAEDARQLSEMLQAAKEF